MTQGIETRPKKGRRYERIALPKGMLIAWQSSGERTVSRIGTLGLGGLFIYTEAPPPRGEIIKLFFEVPGGDVRARAVVRDSQQGKGMGVEFTAMGAEERARLNRLLRRLLR
ncbi:MAG: PilZ domain-containing protein [Acidobacteria bacterium]|nr:PilZ domain-containing protein [Acidobacteriota bacterium]